MTHTPAPWMIEETALLEQIIAYRHPTGDRGGEIARLVGGPADRANARLIVASPVFYDALCRIATMDFDGAEWQTMAWRCVQAARAALSAYERPAIRAQEPV